MNRIFRHSARPLIGSIESNSLYDRLAGSWWAPIFALSSLQQIQNINLYICSTHFGNANCTCSKYCVYWPEQIARTRRHIWRATQFMNGRQIAVTNFRRPQILTCLAISKICAGSADCVYLWLFVFLRSISVESMWPFGFDAKTANVPLITIWYATHSTFAVHNVAFHCKRIFPKWYTHVLNCTIPWAWEKCRYENYTDYNTQKRQETHAAENQTAVTAVCTHCIRGRWFHCGFTLAALESHRNDGRNGSGNFLLPNGRFRENMEQTHKREIETDLRNMLIVCIRFPSSFIVCVCARVFFGCSWHLYPFLDVYVISPSECMVLSMRKAFSGAILAICVSTFALQSAQQADKPLTELISPISHDSAKPQPLNNKMCNKL